MSEVTLLLQRAGRGDAQAMSDAFVAIYDDLHKAAHKQLGRGRGTLDTTGLVNETWLKLNRAKQVDSSCREHFMALASKAMRQIVLDHARHRQALRRGSGIAAEELIEEAVGADSDALALVDLIALDRALDDLSDTDTRLARLVEMRYFGGYGESDIAEVLGVTERTVRRDWRRARAFLLAALQ